MLCLILRIMMAYAPGLIHAADWRTQLVGAGNAFSGVKSQQSGSNPVEKAYVVNLVGSTVFDGEFFYEYDAWNRLVRVSEPGTVTAASFGANGVLREPEEPPVGTTDMNDRHRSFPRMTERYASARESCLKTNEKMSVSTQRVCHWRAARSSARNSSIESVGGQSPTRLSSSSSRRQSFTDACFHRRAVARPS